jgi:hypothetical protein
MTDRLPHDGAVSQQERFNIKLHDIVIQMTRSYASMAMILMTIRPLLLQYEDRFFNDPQTLRSLGEWLGLALTEEHLMSIFESLEASKIRTKLQGWVDHLNVGRQIPLDAATHYDPATQLHPGHIGDGRIGKGKEKLTPERYEVISRCFCGFGFGDQWRTSSIVWSSWLFTYSDSRDPGFSEAIESAGKEALLVYGPYLFLPEGHWRAIPLIQTEDPARITVDVYTMKRGILQLRMITLPAANVERISLEFDHVDHLDPLEIRFSSVCDGNQTRAIFSGVALNWLGPCDPQPGLNFRKAGEQGILSLDALGTTLRGSVS